MWRWRDYIFYHTPARRAPEDEGGGGYRFTAIAAHHIDSDSIFATRGRASRFRSRIESEHKLYGFIATDGQVASYVWLTVASERSLHVPFLFGLYLLLEPGQGYIWDCATLEEHQNRGLYRRGLRQACSIAAAQESRQVFICCDIANTPSRRGISSAGFDVGFEARTRQFGRSRTVHTLGGCLGPYRAGEVVPLLRRLA